MRSFDVDDVLEVEKNGESIGVVRRSDKPVIGVVGKALGPYAEADDTLIQPTVNSQELRDWIGKEVIIMPIHKWETSDGQ
jgi:hypothetical protein